jgi:metal-dependent amidase/aminoacylase/carboxypeptidase family protein
MRLEAMTAIGAFGLAAIVSAAPAKCGEMVRNEEMIGKIRDAAPALAEDLKAIRRDIHRHPELSGQEERTAALVARELRALGLEVETGVGGHGVVGVLTGGVPGPVVAYRADMDAVRSAVVGDPEYKSEVPGVKHVCGHDAHVAVGIGVARVLAGMREELPGTVKFLFQPAEETAEGALAMIEDGVLEDPAPAAIFALHTTPYPVGKVGLPPGVGLSGILAFRVRLRGDSGVREAADRVVQAVGEVGTVPMVTGPADFVRVMRDMTVENGPLDDFIFVARVNRESVEGGIDVQGWLRASGRDAYDRAKEGIEKAIGEIPTEVRSDVEFTRLMPDMHSDPELVYGAIPAIRAAAGEESVLMIHASAPYFGEDFAFFQEHIPGAMFFLGVANEEEGITAYNHFPDYDLDESALTIGTAVMAAVLVEYLAVR